MGAAAPGRQRHTPAGEYWRDGVELTNMVVAANSFKATIPVVRFITALPS